MHENTCSLHSLMQQFLSFFVFCPSRYEFLILQGHGNVLSLDDIRERLKESEVSQ